MKAAFQHDSSKRNRHLLFIQKQWRNKKALTATCQRFTSNKDELTWRAARAQCALAKWSRRNL